jgi:hypothetical protein
MLKDINTIPPITNPLGRAWEQPAVDQILVDDDVAMMTEDAFQKLLEYSHSTPTGVYPGKMWKARRSGVWYLRWYSADDGHPDGLPTPYRQIIVI